MHDAIKVFVVVVSALFPIVDPLSASPIFLALTSNIMPATRRKLSWQVTLNSFILLVGSYFMGSHVLDFVGVSLPAVQVGGGFVVVAVGWRLLMQKEGETSGTRREVQSKDIMGRAFYPLTLPVTVGPGSISVAVTVGAHSAHNYGTHFQIILAALIAMGLVAASIFLCYAFADWLGTVLRETGTAVVIRLSSFLLVCIGVQIVWNGISSVLPSVQLHRG
jgi:multiple antibiotic resistance protein